jgi:hypothetical protein
LSGPCHQAARTEFKNFPTSSFSRLLSADSNCAAESTCEEADQVSVAPSCTSVMLAETCWVPCAACCTLREISWVAAQGLDLGISTYPMSATVTVHRVGLLDITSIIEPTIPATGNPFNITIAFSPRYWAYRQRRASRGSVISTVCIQQRHAGFGSCA